MATPPKTKASAKTKTSTKNAKTISSTKNAKTKAGSKNVETPPPNPEVALHVLESELKAIKQIGLIPEPNIVLAWFPTASTQLRKFIGPPESAVVVAAFENAVNVPLQKSEGYDRYKADSLEIKRALGQGVAHAGSILEHYVRALRDEVGAPKK